MSANIHVVLLDDGWVVRSADGKAVLSGLSEEEAIDVGREIARLHRVGFFIYGPDGRIREQYSYEGLGHDSLP